jgi:cyclohexanone monooxygenase
MEPAHQRKMKARYAEIRQAEADSFAGMAHFHSEPEPPPARSALEVSDEERRREFESRWASGGLCLYNAYTDLLLDPRANDTAAVFVAEKIRGRVRTPGLAEKLIPTTFRIMTRRLPGDTGYCEAFDRDNVSLVEVNKTPIERFTREGAVVGGKLIPLDTIIFATGFDVGTGAIRKIDVRGRGGRRLADHWKHGYRGWLGMMAAGFPNLFWVAGPGYAFVNGFQIAEYQGGWVVRCMDFARERGVERLEPNEHAESAWMDHHHEIADQTLFPQGHNYYMGDNIAGKPRVPLVYFGGFPQYRERCEAVVNEGYRELRTGS